MALPSLTQGYFVFTTCVVCPALQGCSMQRMFMRWMSGSRLFPFTCLNFTIIPGFSKNYLYTPKEIVMCMRQTHPLRNSQSMLK